jgi:hypothetical protein
MKTIKKSLSIIVLFLIGLVVWFLPTGKQLDLSDQLAALPDDDLRSRAEKFWNRGQEESAMIILDYMVDQEMGDKAAAMQLREDYLRKLQQDKTLVGRLKSAGWGLVSGEVSNWESLAGSTVGDLVVYGDLRDLFREIVLEDNADKFVVTLSTLGLATTLFPPADPAVSIVKALKKTGDLAEPMIAQLGKVAKAVKATSDNGRKIEHLKEGLLPFYNLSKHTKTWADYATLIKHADSLDQVKAITKIAAHQPGNGRKLSQILTVAADGGIDGGKRAIDVIMTHGQKGMDSLYAAIRKGPKGTRFLAKHPTLAARGIKNLSKVGTWLSHESIDWLRKLGAWATLLKAGVLAGLTAALCWLLVPRRILLLVPRWILQRILPRNKTSTSSPSSSPPSAVIRFLGSPASFVIGAAGLVFIFILLQPGLGGDPAPPGAAMGGYPGAYAPSGNPASSPLLSPLMVVLSLGVQFAIWVFVRNKLDDIDRPGDSSRLQLKRLDNLDTFFDLPLYAGLALTIVSFILITYNPGVSRLLAYTSTVIGIIVAVALRVFKVHPLKERLVKQSEEEMP